MSEDTKLDERKPIVLGPDVVALIQIYTRTCDFADIWVSDLDPYMRTVDFEGSAKEFVDQLKDHWCVAFMEALVKEIKERIKDEE